MEETWYWVDIHYATFGIAAREGRITQAAPIASWMLGKTLQEVKPWLLKKRARVIQL